MSQPDDVTPDHRPQDGDSLDTDELFAALSSSTPGIRDGAREALVLRFLPLAHRLARRYDNRGIPLEDLRQVAALALVKAVDRFDPAYGADFPPFACPTIVGELKRHFRDFGWTLKVSRRIKDQVQHVAVAQGTLAQQLGRQPTVEELSSRAGLPAGDVREVLGARHAYSVSSVEALAASRERFDVGELLPCLDPDLETAEAFHTLRPALAQLPPRERLIIGWRFYEGVTQHVVAGRLGISQMHVSRLQTRALARLRYLLGSLDAPTVDDGRVAVAS